MQGPLNGIKVIEFAGIGPGPFCAMMLADMGAEVIRIDRKRQTPNDAEDAARKYDVTLRGRRNVALDLKNATGVDTALSLVQGADALIEGFRPGVMERLGLGPDACLARNPKLVYGRMTGWGQTGPLANLAGHDINYISLTGALHAIGTPDKCPVPPLNLVGDYGGGAVMLAFGIACALLEAARSGQGQVVDAAMTDGAALLCSVFYGMKAAGTLNNVRGTNLLDGGAHFYGTYECSDGRFISIAPIEPQFYAVLMERLGLDLAEYQPQMDAKGWPQLRERLASIFKTKPRDHWNSLLSDTDACFAPVLDWDEAPRHPHNKARETFVEVGGIVQPAPAPRFSRTPGAISAPPAPYGEQTEQVLKDYGYSAHQIAALRTSGAI